MVKEDLFQIKRASKILGVDENGKFAVRMWVYSLLLPVLAFGSIAYLINNGNNLVKQMDGLKGILIYVLCETYVFVIACKWNNITRLVDSFEKEFYKVFYPSTKERLCLETQINDKLIKQSLMWRYMIDGTIVAVIVPCFIVLGLRMMKDGFRNLDIEKLHLPLAFHYPREFKSIYVYLIVLASQSYVFVFTTCSGILVAITPFMSMQRLVGDLKLLRLAVKESNIKLLCNRNEIYQQDLQTKMREPTKCFVEYFVKHHQYLYRKAKNVTRDGKYITFILNSSVWFLTCTVIYSATKGDEIIFKLKECLYSFTATYYWYCYNWIGETITNEDENIRQELYQIGWIDKQLSFKRSFHIVLTRMTKPLEIKEIGIFSLNLRNFVVMIQAAYSFYNVLNSLTN